MTTVDILSLAEWADSSLDVRAPRERNGASRISPIGIYNDWVVESKVLPKMKKLAALLLAFLCFQSVAIAQPAYDDTNNQRLGQYWLRDANTALPNGQVLNDANPLPPSMGGTGGTAGGVSKTSHVVTSDDETGTLTNSRQLVDGTNTTVDTTTPGRIKINASGGGSSTPSPFLPPSVLDVPTLNDANPLSFALLVSPDGDFEYLGGPNATSLNHNTISKINRATGAVVASIVSASDGGNGFQSLAISPDGAFLYAIDSAPNPPVWHKIDTAAMTSVHSQTLVALPSALSGSIAAQEFDLSPDGNKYVYVVGLGDDNAYSIDTNTYVQTPIAVGHSDDGTLGASAVGFYNGSSSDFYVAYTNNAHLDLYASGVYSSTVDTGLTGTINILALRSGVNGTIFAMNAQGATATSVVAVNSGTPTIFPVRTPIYLAVNLLTSNSMFEGDDICSVSANNNIYLLDHYGGALHRLPVPSTVDDWNQGIAQSAWLPGDTGQLMAISANSHLQIWSLATIVPLDAAGAAGNVQTSDGEGNWISEAPAPSASPPTIVHATSNPYTINLSNGANQIVQCDNNVTLNLPSLSTALAAKFQLTVISNGNFVTLAPNGNQQIGFLTSLGSGPYTYPLVQGATVVLAPSIDHTNTQSLWVPLSVLNDNDFRLWITTTDGSIIQRILIQPATQTGVTGSIGIPDLAGGSVNMVVAGGNYSGSDTLSSGTVTITCTPCTTSSIIGLQNTGGSLTNVGTLQLRTKSNGSFVVDSTNVADTSTFDWWVVKP